MKHHVSSARPVVRPIVHAMRAAILGMALVGSSSAVLMPSSAYAQQAPSRTYAIPAGPLGNALTAFASASDITLSFGAEQARGLSSEGLKGVYTVETGLARLLAGSGLEAVHRGGGNYVLQRLPSSGAVLPEVRVTAGAESPLASRQERGYRSRSSAASGFREQEVLNTPFSVSTISAEVIEDQQAKSLAEVVRNDPSVTPASDPLWFDRVNIRGFYLSVDAIYRDGLSINDQGSIALENKAAIEINKGLSALRYGATSPGGTVNYVVKRPTDEPLRKLNVSADGYGSADVHADLGGRFGEHKQFGYRINVAGGELRNHIDAFKGDKRFISGFFDWQVTDQLQLELDIEHQRLEKLSARNPGLGWWASTADARAAFSRLRSDTYSYQSWAMEPNEQTNIATRANYRFSDEWKATIAVQDSKLWRDQNSSTVGSAVTPSGEYNASIYYSPDQERNNRAYQFVMQGDVKQGDVRHEIAFGYDSIRRDMTWSNGVSALIGTDNIFNPRGVPRPPVGHADAGPSYLANRTEQNSWFLTDTLILSEQWRVFGGLRHTSIQQFAAGSATASLEKAYDKSATNPTVGLIYKPAPAGTLYASYAEGIEQGGIVPDDPIRYTNPRTVLKPLESKQYEVGAKWELASDTLITAALFEIEKGLEIDRASGLGMVTRVQDGRQVHRGVEFTAAGQVNNQLRLIAGLAYLKAEIQETDNAALVGKRPQGVPDWQANLYADYALDKWVPGLSANGGLYYSGKKAIDTQNTWMADSFVRVDAGLRYKQNLANGQSMTYRLSVYNLTDKEYLSSTTFGTLLFGSPRTVRLSASYSF